MGFFLVSLELCSSECECLNCKVCNVLAAHFAVCSQIAEPEDEQMDHTCSKIPSDLTLCLRERGRGREREGREGGRGLDLLLLTLCRVICPQPPYFLAGFWGSFTFLSRLQNTSETSPVRKGGVHRGEGKRISQTPSALLISAFLIEVRGCRDFFPGATLMFRTSSSQ